MKLELSRKEFADAVTAAQAAASARTSINILQHLLIEASDHVRITGCDGEMFVVREIPAMVTEPGSICLHAKTLNDIVASLPDGTLSIETFNDSSTALLKQGFSEVRLPFLDPEDFPPVPEIGRDGHLTLSMDTLRAAVDSVLYAVSADAHRAVLTGVLFAYNGHTLTLVATDTHRLAVRKLTQEGIGDSTSAIVPDKALRAIKSLPIAEDSPVELFFGGGRVGVETGNAKVVCQLLAGTYPNWERVVPAEFTRTWSVEADQMLDKVKRAMIFARDNANRVRFKGDGDQIIIAARSEDGGDAKDELAMIPQNGDVEIAFNGKYVRDVLDAINGPGVRVEMTESSRPAVFRPADEGDNYFCVIMPMALA
ncbi:DNA polymerase III subunit beta [soil metagenome]